MSSDGNFYSHPGYSMWLMTFHKDKSVLVIATKQDVAKNMVTKVRFMNDNLPSWMKEKATEDNIERAYDC